MSKLTEEREFYKWLNDYIIFSHTKVENAISDLTKLLNPPKSWGSKDFNIKINEAIYQLKEINFHMLDRETYCRTLSEEDM